jgi:ERCC4-type nuclease
LNRSAYATERRPREHEYRQNRHNRHMSIWRYHSPTATTFRCGGGGGRWRHRHDRQNGTMTTAPQELPALPALRCLGALADVRPTIVVDTREQDPLTFARLASERAALQTGDYSFRGGEDLFSVERKTVGDLVSCCIGENRERFFRELHRLRGYRFKRLLVIGTVEDIELGDYRSAVRPSAVLATLAVIEARFDVPAVFAATPEDGGRQIERWAYWFAREMVETVNTLARDNGLTRRESPPPSPSP